MAAIISPARPEIADSLIRVVSPVSSRTWQAAAHLANWLRGKGACLVPWCVPEREIAVSTTETFRFRVKTRSSAIQRVWLVLLRTADARVVTATLRAPAGTGTAQTQRSINTVTTSRVPVVYVENLASRSNAEQEISLSVEVSGSVAVIVEGIACYEQDRAILSLDSTDYGVDVTTIATGQPIYDGANRSIGGVMDALANADARRVGIWHWSVGDSELATTSSASYTNLLSLSVPALGRKLARSAVAGSVKWSVYAKMSAAGTGNVRLTTSNSGVSDVMPVTSTSYAWTTARTVSIDCEDLAADDGRQGTAWDDLMVAFAGNGTQSIIVKSISIWSDD